MERFRRPNDPLIWTSGDQVRPAEVSREPVHKPSTTLMQKDVKRTWREKQPFRGLLRRPREVPKPGPFAGIFRNGETQTRTGDTTIFSRVLYQLSYLAALPDASAPVPRPGCPACVAGGCLDALEVVDERVVCQPQPVRDRHLGAPTQLSLGACRVQAAVLELTRAKVGELRLEI
jgi:hypothetical protein